MQTKKDAQPPAKPKPEELITEFKEKFEAFSRDIKQEVEDVGEGLGNVRETQVELDKLAETRSSEEGRQINDFAENIADIISCRINEFERETKNEFVKLEDFLMKGLAFFSKKCCFNVRPGLATSHTADYQLDNIAEILDEMWGKLEIFEKKKRSNLIFYGVRGEMRETQNDLITKV